MSVDHRPRAFGVRVTSGEATADYSLELADDEVTLAEVLDALGLPSQTAVDGAVVERPDQARAGSVLVAGSFLQPAGAEAAHAGAELATPDADAIVEVAVVAGPDAGHVAVVPAGLYRLCAGSPADPDGELEWMLQIPRSATPAVQAAPWHEHASSIEVVEASAGVVAIGAPIDPEVGAARTLQRPPRPVPSSSVVPIPLAELPAPTREPSPLSWATLLAPVPIALMMAVFFRPIFALFAAMGPVMALGRWFESRRRFRRDHANRAALVAALRADVAAAVEVQSEALARLRWSSHPHVGELRRRARLGSVRLWERRPGAPGFLDVSVGVGPQRVHPVVADGRLQDELHDMLDEPLTLRSVPHTISLADATGLGVHGDRPAAVAAIRSILVQLATLQGPADLAIGLLCQSATAADWDWLKWLPHHDRSLTAHSAAALASALEQHTPAIATSARRAAASPRMTKLVLVDDPAADVALLTAAARRADIDLRVISIAADARSLPAACDWLVGVGRGECEITVPHAGEQRSAGAAIGVSAATAEEWARRLSGNIDPEHDERRLAGMGTVGLLRLAGLGSGEDIAEVLADRWQHRPPGTPPVAAVGSSAGGPVTIDLVSDGPHVLIAGTTGSGKSELLRTLVASLALACPPREVNFVLVDFKGGGAFDAVRRLPHVAGLITDLDETLVERALTGLRAELVRRERLFRALGVSTFAEAAGRTAEPIARLVVVIDEFAALATDHPELMAAVIDLAARGRSLGMHLVLATQRPSGVVDQKIRANTNLRIALRVQDAFDSQDVVGVGDAAHIDRRFPGRAYFRIAGDAPLLVQIASTAAAEPSVGARCSAQHLTLFDAQACPDVEGPSVPSRSQLDALVEAVAAASATLAHDAARPLWSEPLPSTLDWIDLRSRSRDDFGSPPDTGCTDTGCTDTGRTDAGCVVLGLADVTEEQAHARWRWHLGSGPMVVYGASAECAAKVLVSAGAALGSTGIGDVHVYVIDGGAGGLAPLADLAHVGAYIALDELDRIDRAIALLEHEIGRRRSHDDDAPVLVLLIDNVAAVLGAHDDLRAASLVDRLSSLARDGSPRGVHLALTVRTVRDVPHRLAQQLPNRLVMALADPSGYLALGLRARQVPALPAMRAIEVATSRLVQLVEPPTLADWSDAPAPPGRVPAVIRGFPEAVSATDLPAATLDAGVLHIPIGVEAHELGIAGLRLRAGCHALVVGPRGSGRSTLLDTVAGRFHSSVAGFRLVRIGPTPGSIEAITGVVDDRVPTVVVVDDADGLGPELVVAAERLLEADHVRVVAATTPDAARSLRSWTASIRSGGIGILLGRCAGDGDLLGARAERMPELGKVPGRGLLVADGRGVPVQVADATAATDPVWLL